MATITGLKVSELSNLALGSTGTLFLASSAGANSFKMTEIALYNTLYNLHLSGVFQPKNEDWRFVHKTGAEDISGAKRFASSITTTLITPYGGTTASPIINVEVGRMGPTVLSAPSLDWSGRILSGNWTLQQATILIPIVSSLAPSSPTSVGVSGQISISGQKLFICTGTNRWGYLNITPW